MVGGGGLPEALRARTFLLLVWYHLLARTVRMLHARRAFLLVTCALVACRDAGEAYRNAALPPAVRARDLLGRMTAEEKFWQLFAIPDDTLLDLGRLRHGVYGLQVRPRAGAGAREVAERINQLQRHFVTGTRLGIPMLPFEEGLHGLAQGGATVFPQAIGLAATWDSALVARVAEATAREARTRGIRQVLSPVLNLATDVRWGRTEETFGEDPWLASRLGVAFVHAFERAGVVTTPKHFVANVGDGGRDSYPVDPSRRALEELHFPPFRTAVQQGGARSVMASYNSVDGVPATASRWLLTETLRGAWRFEGVVISDAGAVGGANVLHMTAPDYPTAAQHALDAGLDVILQTSADHAALFWPAFADGRIARAAIDSAVVRVLRLKFALGLFEDPYVDVARAEDSTMFAEHRALAREAAEASLVLLHDDGAILPLDPAVRSIAVVGPDAIESRLGGYSGPGRAPVSILDGVRRRAGDAVTVRHVPGPGRGPDAMQPIPAEAFGDGLDGEYFGNIGLEGTPVLTRRDRTVDFSWPFGGPDTALAYGWYSVRWQGTLTPRRSGPLQLAVEGNDGFRLFVDDRLVLDRWRKRSFSRAAVTVPAAQGRGLRLRLEYAEVSGAGRIRLLWNDGPPQDWAGEVRRAVDLARRSDVTIVAVGIEEGEFRDRASLRLPGRQPELLAALAATGRPVVVVVIAGSAVTMGGWGDRVGAVLQAWYPGDAGGDAIAAVLFGDRSPSGRLPFTVPVAEGQLPLSYFHKPTGRGDDYVDLTGRPLYSFGHGLAYTRFRYDALAVEPTTIAAGDRVTVRLRLRNEGVRTGTEVVQLYLRDEVASVARPVLMLAGSARVTLAVGEEREVTIPVAPRSFSLLDSSARPRTEPGRFVVLVGASSADLRLRGTVTVR